MRKIIITTAMMLVSATVFAAAPANNKPEIDPASCRLMATYQPSADVEYKPGVDANGNPVVEADLNPSPIKMPETITFDLNVDVARHAGITLPTGTEGLANIGKITVEKDGHMLFNGQPMEGPAEQALRAICAEENAAPKP